MQDFNPKLSNFVLARDDPTGDNTHVSTRAIGTHGYAAPEYVATGKFAFPFFCTLLPKVLGSLLLDVIDSTKMKKGKKKKEQLRHKKML